ncbi:hypothetical protein V8F33_002142 [Rhypophila sp. PSN 637]
MDHQRPQPRQISYLHATRRRLSPFASRWSRTLRALPWPVNFSCKAWGHRHNISSDISGLLKAEHFANSQLSCVSLTREFLNIAETQRVVRRAVSSRSYLRPAGGQARLGYGPVRFGQYHVPVGQTSGCRNIWNHCSGPFVTEVLYLRTGKDAGADRNSQSSIERKDLLRTRRRPPLRLYAPHEKLPGWYFVLRRSSGLLSVPWAVDDIQTPGNEAAHFIHDPRLW